MEIFTSTSLSKRDRSARVVEALGFVDLVERLPKIDQLLIINYHRLFESPDTEFDAGVFSASAEMFRQHVRYLKRHFRVVSQAEAVDIATGRARCRGTSVLLTFDDGYRECYTLAFPVLAAEGVPATFFLVSAIVGTDAIMWWDQIAYAVRKTDKSHVRLSYPGAIDLALEPDGRSAAIERLLEIFKEPGTTDQARFLDELFDRCEVWPRKAPSRMFLDWDEARHMLAGGMDFGSHTHSHPILGKLPLDDQTRELAVSREILEGELGAPINTVAFPVGTRASVSADTPRALARAGYRAAFSFYGGANPVGRCTPFDLKRVSAEADVTWSRFRLQCALASQVSGYWF